MIVLVSKVYRYFLFTTILLFCLIPIWNIYSQYPLPLEIRITELIYPPLAFVQERQNESESHTNFQFDVMYNIRNPNDEVVSISMPNCYNIPFAHVNASFIDDELRIFYGYVWEAMPCNIPFESGLNENRSSTIYFSIYSYTEDKLPMGYYTFWINMNYSTVYYPTVFSYAFMNVTEDEVEIEIEWEDKTEHYPREVEFSYGFIIFPLVMVPSVITLRRNRKSKKYFI